jgi:hypothetical protein
MTMKSKMVIVLGYHLGTQLLLKARIRSRTEHFVEERYEQVPQLTPL